MRPLAPLLPLALALLLAACQPESRASEQHPAGAPPGTARADTVRADSSAHALSSISGMTDGGAVRIPARYRALHRDDSLWQEALRIHYDALVVDGHLDTPTLMLDEGYDLGRRHQSHEAHADLPRMEEGGLDAAFFSIYVAPGYGEGAGAVARARREIAEVKRQLARYDTLAALATTAAEVRRLAREGRKAILLGLEGGHALAASSDTLRALRDLGIRYVTLTHINTNALADASQSRARHGGLSEKGRQMVRAMNDLGVLVDLSHVSDSTFYDALRVSRAPVILSHSSARALTPGVRNVSDAMLRALAENGGVIMINFFDAVVNPHLDEEVMAEAKRRLQARGQGLGSLWSAVYEVKRERGLPGATLDDVVDHIDHAVQVAGARHVGLGSDFDGVFDLPAGLQDVTRLPFITHALLERGYSEEDLYKILGGNALRVLQEAEAAARPVPEPSLQP